MLFKLRILKFKFVYPLLCYSFRMRQKKEIVSVSNSIFMVA
jgi:hypothetical protein